MADTRLLASDREVALDDGMEAFIGGLEREANPYPVNAPLHVYWDRGWLIARETGSAG